MFRLLAASASHSPILAGDTETEVSQKSNRSTVLDQALLIATENKISWRAFYNSQKSTPKTHFLKSLCADTRLDALHSVDVLEKKFFYEFVRSHC